MPDKGPCPYCGRVGFIRFEYVIKASETTRLFYCGSCARSWMLTGDSASGPMARRKPPRFQPVSESPEQREEREARITDIVERARTHREQAAHHAQRAEHHQHEAERVTHHATQLKKKTGPPNRAYAQTRLRPSRPRSGSLKTLRRSEARPSTKKKVDVRAHPVRPDDGQKTTSARIGGVTKLRPCPLTRRVIRGARASPVSPRFALIDVEHQHC